MDCFNRSCVFRANETSNANRCEFYACNIRSHYTYGVAEKYISQEDEKAKIRNADNKDYGIGIYA